MIDAIRSAFDETTAQSGPAATWVRPYDEDADPAIHQFVIFLKPEVTDLANGLDMNAVIGIVREELERWSVDIGAIRVLNGDYLAEKRIMHAHYGVINQISTQGPRCAPVPRPGARLHRTGPDQHQRQFRHRETRWRNLWPHPGRAFQVLYYFESFSSLPTGPLYHPGQRHHRH
jgi:hypothetical protein